MKIVESPLDAIEYFLLREDLFGLLEALRNFRVENATLRERIARLEAVKVAAAEIVSQQFDTVDNSNGVKYARAIFALRDALRAAGEEWE